MPRAGALAAIYSERPLEIALCDKPTGKMAKAGWIFPELGEVDATAPMNVGLSAFVGSPGQQHLVEFAGHQPWRPAARSQISQRSWKSGRSRCQIVSRTSERKIPAGSPKRALRTVRVPCMSKGLR